MAMQENNVLTPASPLGRFVGAIDRHLHRINVVHLVRGYCPEYSLAVATTMLLVVLTFAFPAERALYDGVAAFGFQAIAWLMVASGLFRASGGVFVQRPRQEEWLRENVRDALHALLRSTYSVNVVYMLLALEVVSELGKVMRGPACVCVVLLVWMGWLLLGEWRGFLR